MNVGLSSATFYPDMCTEGSIKLIKSLGFQCGEVFLNSFSEYDYDFIKMLNEERMKHSFNIISIHSFSSSFEPYLFDKYKRRVDDMFVFYNKVCKAARELGAKFYTFHGMRHMDYNEMDDKRIIDVYNRLAYIALENGIKLAQENVSWCMSGNIEFLNMLKEKCEYPVYFTLDIKQAYKAGTLPEKYISVMDDRLVNIHINDRDDDNVCLLPGRGNVDFKHLKSKLDIIGYSGAVIIEVYSSNFKNYKEITEAMHYIKKFF